MGLFVNSFAVLLSNEKQLFECHNFGLILMTFLSCNETSSSTNNDGNSIYYWRTTFSLNDREKEFIKRHNIKRMYMHFFDVVTCDKDGYDEKIIPEATIRFIDSVPSGIEIIPTIYITVSAIEEMQTKEDEYASKILKRVTAICRQNKIDFKELQFDCDWTKGTRNHFFRLCEIMRHCLDSTQILSSTIRLHQLIQLPPPVDKGVLMVYNTGNLMEMTSDNSIFSRKDIEPYLRDN